MAVVDRLDQELDGLDQLELELPRAPSRSRRIWSSVWPKLAAVAVGLGLWQLVVWSGWKATYLLPAPATVFHTMWDDRAALWSGTLTTLR
jgi:NitT/TauT family transport system permease protein